MRTPRLTAAFVVPIAPPKLAADRLVGVPYVRANIEHVGVLFKAFSVLVVMPGRHWVTNEWRRQAESGFTTFGVRIDPYPVHLVENETTYPTALGRGCDYQDDRRRYCLIARGRNVALHLLEASRRDRTDLMIAVDSDMQRQWSLVSWKRALSITRPWSGITANGIGPLYQHEPPYSRFQFTDFLAFKWLADIKRAFGPCSTRGINCLMFDPRGMPFSVQSNFGGVGIYRLEHVRGCRYTDRLCEHWEFHSCINQRHPGQLLLHPALTIEWKGYPVFDKAVSSWLDPSGKPRDAPDYVAAYLDVLRTHPLNHAVRANGVTFTVTYNGTTRPIAASPWPRGFRHELGCMPEELDCMRLANTTGRQRRRQWEAEDFLWRQSADTRSRLDLLIGCGAEAGVCRFIGESSGGKVLAVAAVLCLNIAYIVWTCLR